MGFVTAKCEQCGANIVVDNANNMGICSHCGSTSITEKVVNSYNTYNNNVIIVDKNADVNVLSNMGLSSAEEQLGKLYQIKDYAEVDKLAEETIEKYPLSYDVNPNK